MKTLYKDRTNYQGSLLVLIFSPQKTKRQATKKLSDGQITLFLQWFHTFLEKTGIALITFLFVVSIRLFHKKVLNLG